MGRLLENKASSVWEANHSLAKTHPSQGIGIAPIICQGLIAEIDGYRYDIGVFCDWFRVLQAM